MVIRYSLALFAAAAVIGGPSIDKVEPPNWWTGTSTNTVQILLTGTDLQGATVKGPRGLSARVRHVSENGHYAFVYADIPRTAAPGEYVFELRAKAGPARFSFPLLPAPPREGRVQGFTPNDVIYLLVPDRFSNGEETNDALPESGPPADRTNPRYYHGGDFKGIENRLGYLKDLGVTAIWMLPVYRNSWKGKPPGFFYGYEAADYYDTDPRYGTMADLKRLIDKAHAMGIKVMQDQVANHCGPGHYWAKDPPTQTWFNGLERVSKLRNNFDIAALSDPYARPSRKDVPVLGWFGGGLPDLNQEDPLVNDYLIQNTIWWVAMTGVDGIRQDTYPYTGRAFWERWQTAINREFPSLFVTGEITAGTPPVLSFFEGGTRRYGTDTKLTSMLDFPLQNAIRNVFGKGESMSLLSDILAQDSLYLRPDRLVSFLGNHDVPRFLTISNGNIAGLRMAQAFLLTSRGIPHLYYGDEVAMGIGEPARGNTQSRDFPGAFRGDAVDAFTAEGRTGDAAEVFSWLRSLLHFRREHAALRGGRLVNLAVGQDHYAYLRSSGSEHVLVLFHRGSPKPFDLSLEGVDLPEGLGFQGWRGGRATAVRNGRIVVSEAGPVEIYWAVDKRAK